MAACAYELTTGPSLGSLSISDGPCPVSWCHPLLSHFLAGGMCLEASLIEEFCDLSASAHAAVSFVMIKEWSFNW